MGQIEIIRADITTIQVDAIVNAANNGLRGGGGVDGAIHRAAGPELLAECRTLGGCDTGDAKITRGYNLPARWVIHTVGPVWSGGGAGEDRLLASCYERSISVARQAKLNSVAFSAISCGVYGYPIAQAADIAVQTVATAVRDLDMYIMFTCFSSQVYQAFIRAGESVDIVNKEEEVVSS